MAPERDPSLSSQNSPLLRFLRYIFLGAFAVSFLSKLRTPSHDSSSPQDQQDSTSNATQIRRNIASPVHVVVDASPPTPTPNKEREAREGRQEGRDKKRFRVEIVGTAVLAVYTIVTGGMWVATKDAAEAARNTANWNEHQAKDLFSQQRPRLWGAVPDHVRIEAGKPIKIDFQIFNHGKTTGIARAKVRLEAGPGIIDNFRNSMRHNSHYLDVPDEMGTFKAAILPDHGTHFPIETQDVILSQDDIKKLAAGTIDVAIYGRIFYTDLALKAEGERISNGTESVYRSLFCFYVMPNGTTSACPNQTAPKQEAFTNWVP